MAQVPNPIRPASTPAPKASVGESSSGVRQPVPGAPIPAPRTAPVAAPKAGAKPQSGDSERRRGQRVLLIVPVEITWETKDGLRVKEHGETEVVSQHGAMLKLGTKLLVGSQLEISRPALGKTVQARVVGTSNAGADGLARVAIELSSPSENFWGISFPPMG